MKVVSVKWIDSRMDDCWQGAEEAKGFNPELACSVGFLLCEDEEKVVLVQTFGKDNVQGLIAIPKVCIKDMKEM